MTDEEAIAECKRWLAHLERQRLKSIRLQELARRARQGPEEQAKAKRELRTMDNQPHVYDAANLQTAVQHLVDHFHEWKIY